MHRLLYTSEVSSPENTTAQEVAEKIAAVAGARNASLGLTGILFHVEGAFIQVLEGKLHAIEGVFEQICCDFRHREVRLIDLNPIQTRLFADWNMACLSADSTSSKEYLDELNDVRFLVGINAGEAIHEMRRLLDRDQVARAAA